MKTLYFWIIVLSCVGVFASLYLIPNDADVAFLHLKTKHYKKAKSYYQNKQLKEGESANTLYALSQIEEREGNIQKAIFYMERCIKKSPKDSKAYRRLADLYLIDQNMPRYIQTLLQLEQLSPRKIDSPLDELVSWYLANGETKPLKAALEKLIGLQYATADDYLLLATIYANEKRYEEALSLLKVRRAFFSKALAIDEVLLEIYVMENLQASRQDRLALFTSFLLKQKDPKVLRNSIQIFTSHYPEETKELLHSIGDLVKEYPGLQTLALLSLWEDPDSSSLILDSLKKQGSLYKDNPSLQNLAFVEFVEKGNIDALQKLLEIIPIENIEERNITYATTLALEEQNPYLLLTIKNSYPKGFLKENPTLQILLSLALKEEEGKTALDEGIKKGIFTPLKSYFLMQVTAKLGLESETLALGRSLLPYHGRSLEELLTIISCYTSIGKAKELSLEVQSHEKTIGKKRTKLLLAALAIPLRKTQETAEFVRAHPKLTKNTLYALHTLAVKYHKAPLALYLSKIISRDYPSIKATILYGESLVQVGKADKGLSILENLYHKAPNDEAIKRAYFSSLALAAKKNHSYIPRLKKLINKVQKDPKLQREIALVELETLHNFAKAKEIYYTLLKTPSHRGEDIATFTYLLGPSATKSEVQFVIHQAKKSSPSFFPLWLEGLAFMGQSEAVVLLFKERNEPLSLKGSFALMSALSSMKSYQELSQLLPEALEKAHSLEEFERLASYALIAGDLPLEKKILEKSAALFPHELSLWENLARSYYENGEFTKALTTLDTFFSMEGASAVKDLYQSYYRYGEILYARREYERARGYFIFALNELKNKSHLSFSALGYKALILYRIGEGHKAKKVAEALYDFSSQDGEAAAVYGSLLLELGKLQEAGKVLESEGVCR